MNLNVNSINIILISILSFLFSSVFPASVLAGSHIGVRDKILNEIKKYDAKVGVAVIFNGEDTLVVNNEDKYPLMSVFKFHQALAVGNYLQSKGIGYDSVVYVSKDELKENTYSPLRDKYPEGNLNISIADLLAYTIQMSDNNACDILFDKIVSVDSTDKYIRSAGIKDFSIEYNEELGTEPCRRHQGTAPPTPPLPGVTRARGQRQHHEGLNDLSNEAKPLHTYN